MALVRHLVTRGLTIAPSPGDGHCLLHSICRAWSSQLPHLAHIDLHHVKSQIFIETTSNSDQYLPLTPCMSRKSLFHGLNNYLLDKHYDQFFGDIVPRVISNALQVQLHILNETPRLDVHRVTVHPQRAHCAKLDIHRRGDHYNAITTAFPPGSSVITPKGNAPNAPNQPDLLNAGLDACGYNTKHPQKSPSLTDRPLAPSYTAAILRQLRTVLVPYAVRYESPISNWASAASLLVASTLPCWETPDN